MAGALAAVAASVSWGCVVEQADVPAVTAPSGFAYAISVVAAPAQLPRDGRTEAAISIVVRDPAGMLASGRHLVLAVSPSSAVLSPTRLVTDGRGHASATLTAPPAGTTGEAVTIQVMATDPDLSGPPRILTIPLLGPVNRTRPLPEFLVSPATPEVGQPVAFDASATRDEGSPCDEACAFAWDFGDGGTGTGIAAMHRFSVARSYVVTLTVTDQASARATIAKTVTVRGVPPPSVTLVVSPDTPIAGQPVSLAAVASAAPGHGIVKYEWDFGDGTRRTTVSPSAIARYQQSGRFTATVVVTDDLDQQASAAALVQVDDVFVFPDPVFTFSPSNAEIHLPISFSAAGVRTVDGSSITRYEWDFGDGSPVERSAASVVRHAFSRPRTYVVTLTVIDGANRVATRTREVTIQ